MHVEFADVLSLKIFSSFQPPHNAMAPSATPSKMSKAETMRAEAARKIKEMEAAIKQAKIEEELE